MPHLDAWSLLDYCRRFLVNSNPWVLVRLLHNVKIHEPLLTYFVIIFFLSCLCNIQKAEACKLLGNIYFTCCHVNEI